MKNIVHIVLILLIYSNTIAQNLNFDSNANIKSSFVKPDTPTQNFSLEIDAFSNQVLSIESEEIAFSCFGIGVQLDMPDQVTVDYRIFLDQEWTEWTTVELEYQKESNSSTVFWSDLIFVPNQNLRNKIEFKINTSQAAQAYNTYLDAYNVIDDQVLHQTTVKEEIKSVNSCLDIPTVVGRDQWLEPYYGIQNYTPTIITPGHIVIHHGASPNTYTDGAAVVRSYWNYHVNTLGWDDIGYNFLTDQLGNIYHGRKNADVLEQDVRGAHAGAANNDAIGINFLGNSDVTLPTNIQLEQCSQLMAWWFNSRGFSPTSSGYMTTQNSGILDIPRISGHGDVNIGATACPGSALYAELPGLRLRTQNIIDICNSNVTTEISEPYSWKTNDFITTFTDQSISSSIKESFYQVIDFDGNYWGANTDNGFLKDNFYNLNSSWESFDGTWGISNNNLVQSDENSSNTILSKSLNQNDDNRFLYHFTSKIGGQGSNRRAGLHFMCDDNALPNRGNSYFVYFRLDNNEIQIFKVENDIYELKENAIYTFDADTFYDLKISFNKTSGELIVFVDDQKEASWVDINPYQSGEYVSFRTANCTMEVSEFQVFHSRNSSETITVGNADSDVRFQNPEPSVFSAKIKSIVFDELHAVSPIAYHNLDVDWSIPFNTLVRDGLESDISYFIDPASISSNWDDAIDENSSVQFYEYCIGTDPGFSDITGWTNNGLNTNFTESSLPLNAGTTYYVSVRSTNNAGLLSDVSTSDGQELSGSGVDELRKNSSFVLYPNPSSEVLYIEILNNEFQNQVLSIRDISGKMIKQQLVNSSRIALDIEEFENGLYFLQISQFSKVFVKK